MAYSAECRHRSLQSLRVCELPAGKTSCVRSVVRSAFVPGSFTRRAVVPPVDFSQSTLSIFYKTLIRSRGLRGIPKWSLLAVQPFSVCVD